MAFPKAQNFAFAKVLTGVSGMATDGKRGWEVPKLKPFPGLQASRW